MIPAELPEGSQVKNTLAALQVDLTLVGLFNTIQVLLIEVIIQPIFSSHSNKFIRFTYENKEEYEMNLNSILIGFCNTSLIIEIKA